jgi:hypothetical protein
MIPRGHRGLSFARPLLQYPVLQYPVQSRAAAETSPTWLPRNALTNLDVLRGLHTHPASILLIGERNEKRPP